MTAIQIEKDRRELSRRVELANKYEGIIDAVEDSDRIFDLLELMIPDHLKQSCFKATDELEKLVEQYVLGKESTTGSLRPAWERYNEAKEATLTYDEQNRHNKWKVTRRVEKALRSNLRDDVIRMLNDNDCTITPLTLHRITERTFLKNLIPQWNRHLASIGVNIIELSLYSPSYIYTVASRSNLKWLISHSDLAYGFGHILFGEAPYLQLTERNLLMKSVLHQTPASVRLVVDAIKDNCAAVGLHLEEIDEFVGRIIFRKVDEQTYLQTSIKALVEKVAPIVSHPQDGIAVLQEFLRSQDVEELSLEQLRLQREAGRAFGESQRITRRSG